MKFASGDRFHQPQARRDVPFVADGRHMIRTNMSCRRHSPAHSKLLVPMFKSYENATDRAGHLPRTRWNYDCTKEGKNWRQAAKLKEILKREVGNDPEPQDRKTSA